MKIVWNIIAFIVALGPLIIVHELGHFTVARLCNVKVLRFSIGFGRPLLKWVRGRDRTEWMVSLIPLGGYVAMLDERELAPDAVIDEADRARAFNRQHVARRIAIVVAGPATNLLVAVLLYAGLNLYGVDEPRAVFAAPAAGTSVAATGLTGPYEVVTVDGDPVRSMVDLRWYLLKIGVDHGSVSLGVRGIGFDVGGAPVDTTSPLRSATVDLGHLDTKDFEGSFLRKVGLAPLGPPARIAGIADAKGAAAIAGLKKGDRIVAIDGVPIDDAIGLQRIVGAAAGKPLALRVDRDGAMLTATVTPVATPAETTVDGTRTTTTVGRIGVELQQQFATVLVRYGPLDALVRGASQTWDLCTFSLRLIGKMLTGQVSLKNLSGPVTIADYARQSAELGPLAFVNFIAFISISLGVMNLLPIPMLDGGHLLYYSAEIVRGRPPSERFLEWSQRVGMFLLAGLMVVALFNDFMR